MEPCCGRLFLSLRAAPNPEPRLTQPPPCVSLPSAMKLRINHQTLYTYTRPVRFGSHRLVVRPREGHDVRVEAMDLTISPPAEVTWTRDVFGNSVATLDFEDAPKAKSLKIVSNV